MAVQAVMHRLAFVDLSAGTAQVEEIPDGLYLDYLGGYGLGAYVLFTRQKANVDPWGPDNMLGFVAGPLTGTDAITGNRFAVVGKSPKTMTWGDANCGGDFGPALKRAGLDGIFFEGIAQKPMYVEIAGGKVVLHDAGNLWGLDSNETEDALQEHYGTEAKVACLGPAGERASLLACIMNAKGRAAGRSGLGALMGSKRVKALVAVPTMAIEVADAVRMKDIRHRVIAEHFNEDNEPYVLFSTYGTPGFMAPSVATGDAGIKNWAGTQGDFPNAAQISDESVIAYQAKKYGCWNCPIRCGGHMKIESGPYACEHHKPEYETLASFGSMCLNDNVESIIRINEICNRAGLDTISTGCTIAYAMECYERGLITTADTGGLDLTWGNTDAIVKLTEQIAGGEGFGGDVLGMGVKAAAEKIGKGTEELAIHVQGEEVPMHDPRCFPSLGASYLLDATPGRHTQYGGWMDEANFAPPGLLRQHITDKYAYTGKADISKRVTCFGHAINAAGVCMFGMGICPASSLGEFMTAATGTEFATEDLVAIGERIANLRLAFNIREGLDNLSFKIPGRILGTPPLKVGPTKGVTVDNETQVREYLAAMGWDQHTGRPTKETLNRVGLDFVAEEICGGG